MSPPTQVATDTVDVYARIRPLSEDTTELCVWMCPDSKDKSIQLIPPVSFVASNNQRNNANLKATIASFSHVFDDEQNQKDIFDRVALPLIEDLIHGTNGLLFTYGVTGSGKTFTMTGVPSEPGILPRALDTLFNSIGDNLAGPKIFVPDGSNGFLVQSRTQAAIQAGQSRLHPINNPKTPMPKTPGTRKGANDDWELNMKHRMLEQSKIRSVWIDDNAYGVFVSYVEIYNNYIYDLLDPQLTAAGQLKSKDLAPGADKYVAGVTEVEVRSTEDAFNALIRGQRQRRVAHTRLNTESSRSHAVFNIRVVRCAYDANGNDIIPGQKPAVAQLSLCDLAGSERAQRTQHVDVANTREAGFINNSLSKLRECISILRHNQQSTASGRLKELKLVPYRDYRLTHLFRQYFESEGLVRMIVCLNPAASDYEENLHVVRFAEMTQEVEVPHASPARHHPDNDLTPGRRKAAQMYKARVSMTIPERLHSFEPLVFDRVGDIKLCSPSDDSLEKTIERLENRRIAFQDNARADFMRGNFTLEEIASRHQITFNTLKSNFKEQSEQLARFQAESRVSRKEAKTAQNEIARLKTTLQQYESNVKMRRDQEHDMRRKQAVLRGDLHDKLEKIRRVKELVDPDAPAPLTPSKWSSQETVTSTGSESANRPKPLPRTAIRNRPPVARRGRSPPLPHGGLRSARHRRSKSAGHPNNAFISPNKTLRSTSRNRIVGGGDSEGSSDGLLSAGSKRRSDERKASSTSKRAKS